MVSIRHKVFSFILFHPRWVGITDLYHRRDSEKAGDSLKVPQLGSLEDQSTCFLLEPTLF